MNRYLLQIVNIGLLSVLLTSCLNGLPVSHAELSRQWDIRVTPTLIFLNGQFQEVSKRIPGVNSLDYSDGYVDDAIDQGLANIR